VPLERATIRRLRSGVVPYWALQRLSVGYGSVARSITQSLEALRGASHQQALFIKGEWGTGKSHLLSFAREAAVSRGFPCASVDLNARSTPLNYPQRFYEAIAETVRLGERVGLRSVLGSLLEDETLRSALTEFAHSAKAGELGWALQGLCRAFKGGQPLDLWDHTAWPILFGADLSWADYTYKREKALNRIETLGSMFDAVGAAGLVIVFDEAETIDQLWNVRSRASAYSVLGRLCRSKVLWCGFGITERFVRTIEADAARGLLGYSFLTGDAAWFLRSWQRSSFTMLEPPTVDVRAARALAATVVEIYKSAYNGEGAEKRNLAEQCVEEWAANPSRNPRRLIRLLIHRLDVARQLITHPRINQRAKQRQHPGLNVGDGSIEGSHNGTREAHESGYQGLAAGAHTWPGEEVESSLSSQPKSNGGDLCQELQDAGLEVIDNRDNGGALWVVGDIRLQKHLERLRTRGVVFSFAVSGGRATDGRPAWYTKSTE
jgi:hypothetical protein